MKKIVPIILWAVFVLSVGLFMAGFFAIRVAHIIPDAGLIYGMLAAHWVGTISACALAIRLSFSPLQQRFWFSVGLALLAVASSYWGFTSIRITSTQTVNGRSQCLFDSRWLFEASLVLAAFTMVFTLWKRWRVRGMCAPGAAGTVS